MIDTAKEVTGWATAIARVAMASGSIGALNRDAITTAAGLLARGRAGLSTIFKVRAAGEPEATAFVYDGARRSFGEVDRRIDALATGLRRRGIGARDAVCLVLHNRPEFFEIEGAMARLGGSAVSVSWRSTPAELSWLFTHCGARAVFFEHDLAPAVEEAQRACPTLDASRLFAVGGDVAPHATYESLLARWPDRDLGGAEGDVVMYTSGTTGRPKGAVRKFGTGQVLSFVAFLERVTLKRGDVHLCVCPLYHSTGFGFAGLSLMTGATIVIERDFKPERFLDVVAREKVTTTAIVPTMLHRLMALDASTVAAHDTRSLRALICGGAQLPGALGLRALDRFGNVLYNFYGSTETGIVTTATPNDLRQAPGTIGRALRGVSIRLLDAEGREVAPGDVGELYTRSRALIAGYHNDDEATRASMRDGHFSVGDLATVDAAGRYAIVGRRRDMVISGGTNIYPVEIEEVIARHADVAQCAVVGVADDEWGERLRAFVVLRGEVEHPSVRASELRSWCRDALSGPKVPREWVFVDALPSNPTGKVLKRELRDWQGEVVRV
jgi:fatty-acyl-CoA synthase